MEAAMRAIGSVGLGMAALLGATGLAAAVPLDPAPSVGRPGWVLPPAWLETRGGDRWIQIEDYLWCRTAAQVGLAGVAGVPPDHPICFGPGIASPLPGLSCRFGLAGPPEIRLEPGEVAHLHLGYTPTSLVVAQGSGVASLAPAEVADLPPATRTGGMIVAAGDALGSRVRYRARIVVTADPVATRISGIGARRAGGLAVLSLSLSEPARVDGCIEPALKPGQFHGAGTFPLIRSLRARRLAAGPSAIALGSLPARRYSVHLRARDRDGNSTYVSRLVTVRPVVR
jgi:hypothetical protein